MICPSLDEWRGCTRVLGGYRTLGRSRYRSCPTSVKPLGLQLKDGPLGWILGGTALSEQRSVDNRVPAVRNHDSTEQPGNKS
jgi:hypothetical protein